MYIPPPGNSQDPGAWNPMGRQSSRNRFQPAVRVIRWKELRGLQHLADGAMCSCYTAELEGHGIVVVKKPSDHSNETREEIERELNIEKAYLANLRHPHIIRLIGSGQRGLNWGFEPFLVLEYLSGGTLGHLITERRRGGGRQVEKGVNRKRGAFELPHFVLDGKKNYIPWAQAMGWARDMAAALHYMHHEASRGHLYICRDLKPDNVGFAADGTLKIFDFGLAKRLKRKSGSNQRYTMTSRTGTVRYMAPEAFLGCSYNEKVDVYAWSHVVAEMLSLDVPYNHMTTQQFRETVALGSRRPHVERRWPRSIQRLLKRCWDADPSARPSFREILDVGTLEQAAGPSHPWLHHLIHRPTPPPTPERDAAAAASSSLTAANAETAVTAATATTTDLSAPKTPTEVYAGPKPLKRPGTAPRGRTSTVEGTRGEFNHHMDARGRGERPGSARAGRGHGARVPGRSNGSSSVSTPPRFRLGPLHIPICFFGGGRGELEHELGDSDDDGVGRDYDNHGCDGGGYAAAGAWEEEGVEGNVDVATGHETGEGEGANGKPHALLAPKAAEGHRRPWAW